MYHYEVTVIPFDFTTENDARPYGLPRSSFVRLQTVALVEITMVPLFVPPYFTHVSKKKMIGKRKKMNIYGGERDDYKRFVEATLPSSQRRVERVLIARSRSREL